MTITRNFSILANGAGSANTLSLGGATLGSNALAVTGTSTFSSTVTHSGTTILSGALTYGGVTLSNAVTGTGNMVLSASPTFTGTVTTAALSGTTITATTQLIGKGTATNDSAAVGYIGENPTIDLPAASAVSVTSGTAANIGSILLQPGQYTVIGNFAFDSGGGTCAATFMAAYITTTSAGGLPAGPNGGLLVRQALPFTVGNTNIFAIGGGTLKVATATTYYFVGVVTFSGGAPGIYGHVEFIRAR